MLDLGETELLYFHTYVLIYIYKLYSAVIRGVLISQCLRLVYVRTTVEELLISHKSNALIYLSLYVYLRDRDEYARLYFCSTLMRAKLYAVDSLSILGIRNVRSNFLFI